MRSLPLILVVFSLLLAISCSKSGSGKPTAGLIGTYRLEIVSGGIAGTTQRYGTIFGYTLELNSDSSFVNTFGSIPNGGGRFTMAPWGQEPFPQEAAISFIYPHDDTIRRYLYLTHDTLYLTDGFMDGYTSQYKKIRD